MITIAAQRTADKHGAGYFRAPRGNRKHNGIDYACYPNSMIFAPIEGMITKVGYPYADDLRFRYLEIKNEDSLYCRVFYVEPIIGRGTRVTTKSILGTSQKLGDRYKDITEHCHIEFFTLVDGERNYIDPEDILTHD